MVNSQKSVLVFLDAISLIKNGRIILQDVSLRLHSDEIMTLIGPNGAGKTSLVRTLLGLEFPSSGQVKKTSKLTIGYVPQQLRLDPMMPLTVRRFLELSVSSCYANEQLLKKQLSEVGLLSKWEVAVLDLSDGERQRVLLARALLRNPDLLVLDEPMQGVDLKGQAELYQLIGNIRETKGCAILLVSHDLHFVMAATDTVVCLNQHVCCSGCPEAIQQDPAYLELFGPQALQGLAWYHHDHSLEGSVKEKT